MRQFDKVSAVFDPPDKQTVRGYAVPEIGERFVWQASWVIEDGPYAGQWAMVAVSEPRPTFVWAPLCDLREISLAVQ